MTRRTNASIAGSAFLAYIALGLPALILSGKATGGEGIAAQLASIAQHASDMRMAIVLSLLSTFCALILGVSLYAITRDEDPDLAMLGLTFRVGEGIIGAISVQGSLGLLWLATVSGANVPNPESAHALGTFLLNGQGGGISAIFFSVGSLFFSWLLLRGRMIPFALAWLGVLSSIFWVVLFPLRIVHVVPGSVVQLLYIPMALFEVGLALWLLIKGAAMPARVRMKNSMA